VLATAIEREQTENKLEEVREAERYRIARDLHDVVLQDAVAALQGMRAAQIETQGSGTDAALNQEVEAALTG
jgi:signal transduction histidine kinase